MRCLVACQSENCFTIDFIIAIDDWRLNRVVLLVYTEVVVYSRIEVICFDPVLKLTIFNKTKFKFNIGVPV